MTPPKFRVYHPEKGMFTEGVVLTPDEVWVRDVKTSTGYLTYEWDREKVEIMQYTGLDDAEGVEMHQGDWFQADNLDRPRCIMWSDADAGWKLIDPRGVLSMQPITMLGEVIGNRYENPELLEPEPAA